MQNVIYVYEQRENYNDNTYYSALNWHYSCLYRKYDIFSFHMENGYFPLQSVHFARIRFSNAVRNNQKTATLNLALSYFDFIYQN